MKFAFSVFLLLTSFVATQVRAQDPQGASLEVTASWLEGKLREYAGHKAETKIYGQKVKLVETFENGQLLRNCKMSTLKTRENSCEPWWDDQRKCPYNSKTKIWEDYKIGDLSEATLEPYTGGYSLHYLVVLKTKDDKPLIERSFYFSKKGASQTGQTMESRTHIPFDRKDIAERVTKAFNRLIELCQGTNKEPY